MEQRASFYDEAGGGRSYPPTEIIGFLLIDPGETNQLHFNIMRGEKTAKISPEIFKKMEIPGFSIFGNAFLISCNAGHSL